VTGCEAMRKINRGRHDEQGEKNGIFRFFRKKQFQKFPERVCDVPALLPREIESSSLKALMLKD